MPGLIHVTDFGRVATCRALVESWKGIDCQGCRDPGWENVVEGIGASEDGRGMPRYYFSLDDGKFLDDVAGTRLSDRAAAILHAEKLARDLAKRQSGEHNGQQKRSVIVVDERGHLVCTVPLRGVGAK